MSIGSAIDEAVALPLPLSLEEVETLAVSRSATEASRRVRAREGARELFGAEPDVDVSLVVKGGETNCLAAVGSTLSTLRGRVLLRLAETPAEASRAFWARVEITDLNLCGVVLLSTISSGGEGVSEVLVTDRPLVRPREEDDDSGSGVSRPVSFLTREGLREVLACRETEPEAPPNSTSTSASRTIGASGCSSGKTA